MNDCRKERWRDCLWITLSAVFPALVLGPFQDTPFIDDWTYAWSVEWLLQHGEVKILEWSSHLNVVQVLWGALFCLPFGFSFTALRISTWVLAVGCLCGLYLLLRELGCPRRTALLGTATLGVTPVFFVLGFTFMTDVPFLALMVWSSFAMVRAACTRHSGWLVAATILACLASGVRVVGMAIPVSMMGVLLFHTDGWGRYWGRVLLALTPVLFLGILLWWRMGILHHTVDVSSLPYAPVNRTRNLQYVLPLLPRMLVRGTAFVAGALGLALLPLSVPCLQANLRGRVVVSFLVLGLFLLATYRADLYDPPLSNGSTWSFQELGATEPLVAGFQPPAVPPWWSGATTLVAWGSASIFFAALCRRLKDSGEAFLAWLTLGHFLLMITLWLFYDRYALVLLPSAIALLLTGRVFPRPRLALGLIALFGVVSFVGVHDHLQYNKALWRAVDDLRQRGVPDSDLDGGYVVNGWLHYAHPERAPRDGQGNVMVPWLTTKTSPGRYQIANSHLPHWKLLKTIPYTRWLGRSGALYILERDTVPPASAHEQYHNGKF
jgi:hypothetical protein